MAADGLERVGVTRAQLRVGAHQVALENILSVAQRAHTLTQLRGAHGALGSTLGALLRPLLDTLDLRACSFSSRALRWMALRTERAMSMR